MKKGRRYIEPITGKGDKKGTNIPEKKNKVSASDKRKNKKAYKKNKSKIKMAAKKYRKSGKGKKMAKLSARMAKKGKTATGKKIVRYS